MCGIIGGKGIGSFESAQNGLRYLQRRGPDSEHLVRLDNGLSFGASRLAMTDPHPRSNQPYIDSNTGNLLVFNGEIFNYKDIRKELISQRLEFITGSDTEVLIKSLSHFGLNIIPRLEGMFSFIFFDKVKNELVMARDYLGKKPLFYSLTTSSFFFASQISLVRDYLSSCSLDPVALASYLQLGYVIDPHTMYEGVRSIQPGEILVIDPDSLAIKKRENYIPQSIINSKLSNVKESIAAAIQNRITGHDKFALSLSGGIDSSIIALNCAKFNLPVSAYSLRWLDSDKEKYNVDSFNAERIASRLGINFKFVDMPDSAHIPEVLIDYVKAMDEPNSNPTGLSMMALYSKISEDGHRLLLTGDGADEIFGGYPRYEKSAKFAHMPQINNRCLNRIISEQSKNSALLNKAAELLISNQSNEFWLFWHLISCSAQIKKIIPDLKIPDIQLFGLELENFFGKGRVQSLMYRDLRTWLPMESNKRLDRVSMWFSIEARSPFQSFDVIANAYHIMSLDRFKKLNKQNLVSHFPDLKQLPINSSKTGFISPLGHWLRKNPGMIDDALKSLDHHLPVNRHELLKLRDAPNRKNFNDIKILWNLVVLNTWLESQLLV
jgi:asparagine synthase (glutamine-hydrolysing)